MRIVLSLLSSVALCCGVQVYGQFTYNLDTEECDFDDKTAHKKAPRKVFLSLGFLLPCIVIITSYSYIYYKARQSSANLLARRRHNASEDSRKTKVIDGEWCWFSSQRPVEGLRARDIRIARTIGVIFLAFLICCTPVSVAHFMETKVNKAALLLLHPLYWAQYCINIFIYVFMNNQYRDAYVNYISQWWPDFKEVSKLWEGIHHKAQARRPLVLHSVYSKLAAGSQFEEVDTWVTVQCM
ncbi:G-protein coupled receptor moody [Portunus trituberculatus]|uniref:G-protein coupled receptor moody n=1 Tax=Portunus trituberculatus TaxID=210409 RepID=A0A5B7GWG4_PORTR|nr:G-protein coupled receptor moody [Portunus trituberculatus]